LHAEENAIMNCTKNPLSLPSGARIYITGMPCNDCLQKLVNFGVKDIIIADRQGTKLENADEDQKRDFILRMSGATITKIALTNRWLQRVFLG
jgi:deoxycytidylate deaminase